MRSLSFFFGCKFCTSYSRCKSKDPIPHLTRNSLSWQLCIAKFLFSAFSCGENPGLSNLYCFDLSNMSNTKFFTLLAFEHDYCSQRFPEMICQVRGETLRIRNRRPHAVGMRTLSNWWLWKSWRRVIFWAGKGPWVNQPKQYILWKTTNLNIPHPISPTEWVSSGPL